MKLKPYADNVVLKQAKLPEKIGSLHVPEAAQQGLPYGEVVEVGPDVGRVDVGDKVFFHTQDASALPYNDEMVIIVKEEAIHCLVEGDYTDIITSLGMN